MTKYNKQYRELIDEINLVETILEETEKKQMSTKDLQEKERLEIRILDYEKHLRSLTNKIEFIESKIR